jgi:methenyltetrahydromethanopterin cyclohydrolase
MPIHLNQRAWHLCDQIIAESARLNVGWTEMPSTGARIIDAGIQSKGGLEAGRLVSLVCLADLAQVELLDQKVSSDPRGQFPMVQVHTEQPVLACLASQYAGWEIKAGRYFAMGSGPMRAAAKREPLFNDIEGTESPDRVVGVLESGKMPPEEVILDIANKCNVPASRVTLIVAPTTSIVGTYQVVARSLETCLHKLHELKFDLKQIRRGEGTAPLPPVAQDTLTAIGCTNDAILYGGQVSLSVDARDDELLEIGPRVPAAASTDYGIPFADILRRVGGDFYRIDPLLFSPACVTFHNVSSGRTQSFGKINLELLERSFGEILRPASG